MPAAVAVTRRFFQAIDYLVTIQRVAGIDAFCNAYHLSGPRYREMKLQYGVARKPGYSSRYFNTDYQALCALVNDFNISALWLLTGRGNMTQS